MASRRRRVRARRGSGSIRRRGERYLAQVSLGMDAAGRRIRHAKTVDTREQAQTWIAEQQAGSGQLTNPVVNDRPDDYLRWWVTFEAPKGKPGRRPLARTTLAGYRVVIERHLIPGLGHRRIGQLTIRDLSSTCSRPSSRQELSLTVLAGVDAAGLPTPGVLSSWGRSRPV